MQWWWQRWGSGLIFGDLLQEWLPNPSFTSTGWYPRPHPSLLFHIYLLICLLCLLQFVCSGRLIRTFADVQYGNHHLTTVEIVYNVISFIIAIVTIVAFTVYAKRTLRQLESEEENNGEGSTSNLGKLELETLPMQKSKIPSVWSTL